MPSEAVAIAPSSPQGSVDPGTASEKPSITAPPTKRLNFDFECEDTGPGIPEDLHQEIFKPFVQGDLALSRKHGGTGLGLAICKILAKQMGGYLYVESKKGVGSTFHLSVHCKRPVDGHVASI